MLFPDNQAERRAFYINLSREIARSRDDRRERARSARAWMLTGSQTAEPARYNKIWSHAQQSSAYLYTPEGVRWGVTLPPRYGDQWIEEEEAAREEFQQLFVDSDADITFGAGVTWAHCYDTVIFKVIVDRNQPSLELIPDPSDVCVFRETEWRWRKQEAIAHFYEMELPTFLRLVSVIPDAKEREALIREATDNAAPSTQSASGYTLPPTIERMVLASASPTAVGVARGYNDVLMHTARDAAEVVKMVEMWVWDDRAIPLCDKAGCGQPEMDRKHRKGHPLHDHDFQPGPYFEGEYRVVTHLLPTERTLWAPINPLEPGKHPFHGLTLNPTPSYIWGIAPVWFLLSLQEWRERRMNDVDDLLGKQTDPPIVATGISGIQDEKLKVLRRKGGTFTNPMPGGKVEPFVVPMPADAFAEIKEFDAMFAEQGGLPLSMGGTPQPGVRSGDQAMVQAMLGAGPTMTKAMLVERCLTRIGTSMLRLHRRVNRHPLRKISGEEFFLSQMPPDLTARVSAHSASPIYTQQLAEKAVLARTQGDLTPEDFVRLLNLPHDDQLAAKARKMSALKAKLAEAEIEMKRAEVDAKVKTAEAKLIQAKTP